MSATAPVSTAHIVSRVAAGLLGGWLFVWGCATLGVALALAAGVSYHEAEQAAYLLAFLLFLIVFCWTFAAASLARVWTILAGGGALSSALAWMITRTL